MSTISVNLFFERLEQSNLLASDILADVRKDIRRVGSAIRTEPLGRRLVNEGLLTNWHVQMLTSGRFAFYLGKYKLLDLLGQGGMGVVFKAEHAALGRIVAIKVLSKERMSNPTVIARFHREIQAAASLNNPHVVVAYDADCVNDTHFLVMEYVEGTNLAIIIEREKTLHVEEACEYIRQAALGLQHAHELGMVHRDIKPSNLIVARRGRIDPLVKILDMGLARFVSEEVDENEGSFSEDGNESGLTLVGQVMGTPDYMSPEQAWNTAAVDIRSDIYSLGCTLFLLLTGRFAFPGETAMAKVMARATSDAPPVSSFEPSVPPELDAVVSKMMARELAERYQTPVEVARALEPFSVLPADVLTLATAEETSVATSDAAPPQETALAADTAEAQPEQITVDAVQDSTHGDAATDRSRVVYAAEDSPPTDAAQDTIGVDDGQGAPAIDPRLEEFLTGLATEAAGGQTVRAVTDTKRHRRRDGVAARKRKRKQGTSSRRRRRL